MKRKLVIVLVAATAACTAISMACAVAALADQPWINYQKSGKTTLPNIKSYQKDSYRWDNQLLDFYKDDATGEMPVVTAVSSNPKVATTEVNDHGDFGNAFFFTKAPGKTTITTTVSFGGQEHVYKTKLTVFKWSNPVSKLTIGKKDYKKKFTKADTAYTGTFKKSKVTVKPASDWKLKSIKLSVPMSGTINKTIKNGSKVSFKSVTDTLDITLKNSKTGNTETLHLQGGEVFG